MATDAPPAFFSYCRDDSHFALRLAEDLKAAGAAVWIDQLDIEPGTRWDRAVKDALANCPRMLVILSPASVDSENVLDEIDFALDKRKTIIPVLYRDCETPLRLRRIQYIDFRNDHARGVKVLLRTLGVEQRIDQKTPRIEKQGPLPAFDNQLVKVRELGTLTGHQNSIRVVAVTQDGQHAVSASNDGTLKVWELASGRELRALTGHTSGVTAVAVTPDGQCVLSASDDHTLKVWDLASGHDLRTLTAHTDLVTAVAVTPDGLRALSGSDDHTLKLWELNSGRELRTFTGHTSWVNAVAVTPDGLHAVSASDDRTLKVWELDSGRELRTLTGHGNNVNDVALTPDGERAVSASGDQTLKVWELGSGRELRTLTGHADSVWAVALTPDGERALSASYDQTLRVWELATGYELAGFKVDAPLYCCAVCPDGKNILAGDAKGVIHCLRLERP